MLIDSLHDTAAPPVDVDFAVVDVETTGLDARRDRVVQIAITHMSAAGLIGRSWSTLVDPRRDPGPVHIHGITPERLRGAPRFEDVEPTVAEMLGGRVLVAHNARFDWGMLAAETVRASRAVQVNHRLCTIALARRLELGLPDFRLNSLAAHCGVAQERWHDAEDDVRVLATILATLLGQARLVGTQLPLAACEHDDVAAWQPTAPRVVSPWADPGPWAPSAPLVQGAKFAVTGDTTIPRVVLYDRALAAGLVPMNSVSTRTRFVVCPDPGSPTVKARRALDCGVPVIDEVTFATLLSDVRPGTPLQAMRPTRRLRPSGPLAGRRVLVLGGPHARAAAVREEVQVHGGTVAVNLTPSVTDVVELDGADRDRRYPATAGLGRLDPSTLDVETPAAAEVVAEPRRLRRGEVVDLPDGPGRWEGYLTWPAGAELDVVALLVDGDERVLSDQHFVYFNQLTAQDAAVELTVDTSGEARIVMELDDVGDDVRRIVLAATTNGGSTFRDIGPVELLLTDGLGAPFVRGICDAATTEQSLLVAEIYRRRDTWRIRSIGQGYDDGLRELAVRYGVDVD